jgi:hypothetical protein
MNSNDPSWASRAFTNFYAHRTTLTMWLLVSSQLISSDVSAAFSQGLVTGTVGVVEPTLIDRPGGFITSISGLANGTNPAPGFDPATAFAFTPHVIEDPFVGNGVASATSMFPPSTPNPTSEATSNGTARLAKVTMGGRAQQVFDPAVGQSAAALMHGGWVDTVTITSGNPLLNGTQAAWSFEINLNSTYGGSGFSGSANVEIEPYVNQLRLPKSTPGFHAGQFAKPLSTSVQHAEWEQLVPAGGGPLATGIVDTATFVAIITLGEAFDLGIFTKGIAVARTNSAFPNAGSVAEFTASVLWGGSVGLNQLDGTAVNDFQIASLSGVDWVTPVPVPGMVWLTTAAVGCLLSVGRCKRKFDQGSR